MGNRQSSHLEQIGRATWMANLAEVEAQPEAMQALKTHLNKTGELSLARLPVGAQARVIAVNGSGAIARRLMEMGVVPGAPVRVIKAAPLGDPIEVRVRGYHLALRRTEAQTITVVTSGE